MNKRQSKLHKKKLLTGDAHLFEGGGGAVSGAAASGAAQGAGGFNWQQFMGFFNNGNQQGGQGQGGQQMQGNGFSNVMNSQGMKTVNRVLTVADKAVDDYKEGNGNDYLAMAQEIHQNSSSGNPIFDAVGQSVDLTTKGINLIDKVIEGNKKRNRMSLEEKIGTFADGGHLFAGGGSATPDTVGDVAGTVAALAGNAVNQAKIKNTDAIEKKITNSNTGMYSQGMSFDDLSNQWASLRQLRRVSAKDLRPNSWLSDVANGVSAGNQGAQAGFKVGGPWGAAIGGVVGTVSSVVGSLFGRSKAKKKARALNRQIAYQNDFNQRTLTNNLENVSSRQTSNLLANFAAYGGPLEYDLQKTYLDNMYMNAQDSKMSAMPNSFQTPKESLYTFGFGGDLSTHGGDWSNGLTWINNGGTHEENPQQGVPIGIAPDGEPNLVEEGEVVFNDYVFSNRLMVPKAVRKKYKLREGSTFADAAKKMSKEAEERPNDPFSKDSMNILLNSLIEVQEEVRAEKKAKETQEAIAQMTPEQQAMLQQGLQEQAAVEQQQMAEQQATSEQMASQELAAMSNGYACGGHLHGDGSHVVKRADGSTDFDNSTFGLNEVIVTANKPQVVPLGLDTLLNPYSLMVSPSVADLTPAQQQILVEESIKKQDEERRKRDFLLGRSKNYYACGGHKKDGDDYTQWLEGLTPQYQNLVKMYGLKNQEELDNMTPAYQTSFINAYDYSQNQAGEEGKWGDVSVDAMYSNSLVDEDLYNSIKAVGLNGNTFNSITPEQWRQVHGNYMEGYNAFAKAHPYIPYGLRNDDGWRKQWDETYEGYIGAPTTTTTPQNAKLSTNLYNMYKYYKYANDMGEVPATLTKEQQQELLNTSPEVAQAYLQSHGYTGSFDDAALGAAYSQMNPEYSGTTLSDVQVAGSIPPYYNVYGKNHNLLASIHGENASEELKQYGLTPEDFKLRNGKNEKGLTIQTGKRRIKPTQRYSYLDADGNEQFVDAIDQLPEGYVKKGKSIYDDTTNVETTQYSMKPKKEKTPKEPKQKGDLQTRSRYAPVVGNALGFGLSFLPSDYSNAERIEAAAKGMGYDRVSFNPIGNYLTYNPFDINYTANQLRAAEQASARNILNTAGGNSGNAMAGLLANNYNSQLAMANAYRQADEYNLAQRKEVEDFNRGTNTTNSQGFLDAAKANQAARAQAQGQYLSAIESAAKMRQLIDDDKMKARSANLSNFFTSLGNIGKENYAINDRNKLIKAGVFGTLSQKPQGWSDKQWEAYQAALATTGDTEEKGKACGGKLKKRRRGLTY